MTKWSPGLLYQVVRRGPNDLLCRYPSRLEATVYMGISIVILGCSMVWGSLGNDAGACGSFWLEGALALVVAILAIRRIWDQRVFWIRRPTAQVLYFRRTPLGSRRETIPFRHIMAVRVKEAVRNGDGDGEPEDQLFLDTVSGRTVLLGRGGRRAAGRLGRDCATLLRVPFRRTVDERVPSA